jgi:hypothetical protein
LSKYALINKAAWRYVQLSDGPTLEGVYAPIAVHARGQDLLGLLTPIVGLWLGSAEPVQKIYCAFYAKNGFFRERKCASKFGGQKRLGRRLKLTMNIPVME